METLNTPPYTPRDSISSHEPLKVSLPIHLPPSPNHTIKRSRSSSTTSSTPSERPGSTYTIDDPISPSTPPPYPLPPPTRLNSVLPEDLKTPDRHVERDPRLIRLTGVHPFNVEAPLSDLYNDGFLTTADLHYVRNHGAVPLVHDADCLDWEFSVEGLVANPLRMTLRDLIADYEQVTYPITLVCAGNRRKEQNVVRKTKGFSWGAAGVSTALWTGVPLSVLLEAARPLKGLAGARYVYFEGADKLPNGHYGTSVKLSWAADPERGMLVSYRMNGLALHPDHGKPLRVVIPGQIGGRSVKWLKRIVVTAEPSDNWYHIYDNRVLPTMISPEASADLPETWKDERYAIYDLNTNSATCFPAHDETLAVVEGGTYKVRGYAYAGGGRRVTRVEVTLDQGRTWRLADISYPEDLYRLAADGEMLYGGRLDVSSREACLCWCFWELELEVAELAGAADVMVRAMDDAMMVQPRDMYWSVLGMMNNPWFRVVIHKEHGSNTLRFEHPTQPALIPGGWMERVKKAGGNTTNGFWGEKVEGKEDEAIVVEEEKVVCMTDPKVDRVIEIDELRAHDGEVEPWFVVNGQVYDGTPFLEGHPGGAASIFGAAGQDATEEFMTIHSENAKAMMPTYHIGTLSPAALTALTSSESETPPSTTPRPIFLQPKAWTRALLTSKTPISSDTKIFTFTLDHPTQAIGLPVGQHLMIRLRDPATREAIIRAYTPLSEPHELGQLRVLIKIYGKTDQQEGGKMTTALDALPLGHAVDFRGPVGKFIYHGDGRTSLSPAAPSPSLPPPVVKRFIMICGGSGITPIFQILRAVLAVKTDATRCLVLYGNRTESDMLLRGELAELEAANKDRCTVVHSLSRAGEGWEGRRGRVDGAYLREVVGRFGEGEDGNEGDLVCVCGPGGMESGVREGLGALGWADGRMVFF